MILTGHGGLEKLQYRTDWPPGPASGQVLIEVLAAGVNNTDINTRIGWYSKAVTAATGDGGVAGYDAFDGVWMDLGPVGRVEFPPIQGADVCGRVVEVGEGVSRDRIGERVIVRTMLRSPVGFRPFEVWTFGSECDGGFAQFSVAPSEDTRAVRSDLTDEGELAAAPCSYGTAENMLHRVVVGSERVLVTGASGGVGLAAVQTRQATRRHSDCGLLERKVCECAGRGCRSDR